MIIRLDLPEDISTLVESSVYDSIMSSYPLNQAEKIKQNIKFKERSQVLEVDSFLTQALLMGKNPYDLKPGLLSSSKVKTSKENSKYITVPVESNKFATVTEKSEGWIHPGFKAKEWIPLFHKILAEQLLELMLS